VTWRSVRPVHQLTRKWHSCVTHSSQWRHVCNLLAESERSVSTRKEVWPLLCMWDEHIAFLYTWVIGQSSHSSLRNGPKWSLVTFTRLVENKYSHNFRRPVPLITLGQKFLNHTYVETRGDTHQGVAEMYRLRLNLGWRGQQWLFAFITLCYLLATCLSCRAAKIFTRYSTASHLGRFFFFLRANRTLISSIGMLPCGCAVLYYMPNANCFFGLAENHGNPATGVWHTQ
jgi:hypothetical protein